MRRRLPLARVAGGLLVLLSVASWAFVTDRERFPLDEQRLEITGVVHADRAQVREAIEREPTARNVFLVSAAEIENRLLELPAVAAADVRVLLPDGLAVAIEERVPVFLWRSGERDFLVDATGTLLAEADAPAGEPGQLPLVVDRRPPEEAGPAAPGEQVDPLDLAVILRLAAVTPELVGSSATALELSIEDEGYVLSAVPESWRAVFGRYTPTLRPPELIDRQVQCLRALLAESESELISVHLAVADDRCGTYRPRATPPAPGPTSEDSPAP